MMVLLMSAALAIPALLSLSLISRGSHRPTDALGENYTRISSQGMRPLLLDKRLSIFASYGHCQEGMHPANGCANLPAKAGALLLSACDHYRRTTSSIT
jgi:hypothetical protein